MIVFFFFISISIFLFLAINLHKTKKQSYQIQNDLTILKDILYTSPNGYYFEYQFQDDIFSYCSDKLCLLLNVKDKKTSFLQLIKNINFNDYQSVLNAFSDLKEHEKSFDIEIESVANDGSRLDTDYIFVNDLAAGQSQSFELFTFVEDEKIESMKKASFKIIEASMY